MIIWLPWVNGEKRFYDPAQQKEFSSKRLRSNLCFLGNLLGQNNELLTYVQELVTEYTDDLNDIKRARWINYDKEMTIQLIEERVKNTCSENGSHFFLSGSHTTSGPTLRACKRMNPDMHIGVFCIDAHADLYDVDKPLWKGNVFSTLLQEGTIDSLVVIGMPNFRRESILKNISADINHRVTMAYENSTEKEIVKTLKLFEKHKVTHVFTSVDIDGLDTRYGKYTAMEYCPFHIILNLADLKLDGLSKSDIEKNFDEIIRPPNQIQGGYHNLYHIGESGISLISVQSVIPKCFQRLKAFGIKIGLECENSKILGDIVELFGLDIRSKTINAVDQLISTIYNER